MMAMDRVSSKKPRSGKIHEERTTELIIKLSLKVPPIGHPVQKYKPPNKPDPL